MIDERITIAANEPLRPVRAGIWKRVLVDSPSLAVDEIRFDAGIATDGHGHGLDQAAVQISGRFEVRLGDSTVELGPGDGYGIPSGLEHSVRCIEAGSYILITARGSSGDHDHGHGDGHDHGQEHGHEHGPGGHGH